MLLERPHHSVDGIHPVDVVLGPHLVQALVADVDMEHLLKPLLPSQNCNREYIQYITASPCCPTCSGKKASPAICSNFCDFAIRYFLSTAKKWIIREKSCTQVTSNILALCKLYPSVCWIFLSELVAFSCSNH